MKNKKSSIRRRTKADSVTEISSALSALPRPARAIVRKRIDDLDEFRQQYPDLYEVMFKEIDARDIRRIERNLEREQRKRGNE